MQDLLDPESYITQDDTKVTGISRSGRVRKRSSKLMDFESPDEVDLKMRRQRYMGLSSDPDLGLDFNEPKILEGILSDSETEGEGLFDAPRKERLDLNTTLPGVNLECDLSNSVGTPHTSRLDLNSTLPDDKLECNLSNPVATPHTSLEKGSSDSDDGFVQTTPANSLYMMEKNTKKKTVIKGDKVHPRAKAQRKDKGKSRITAYMMWAMETRNELLKTDPTLTFSAISKRLGEMWSNVSYNERYQWKRKAQRWSVEKFNEIQGKPTKTINTSVARRKSTPAKRERAASPGAAATTSAVATSAEPENVVQNVHPAVYRVTGCGPMEVAAHLSLLGDSLAIIGARLKEHEVMSNEGQIAVSGSVSVLLDSWLCSVASLLCLFRLVPGLEPPRELMEETLHNIAYIMPGL